MGNDNVKDYPPYLDYPKPRKPTTNADRLRSMSDEELAAWLTICLWGENREVPFLLSCTVDKWLDWLLKEAE